jgi:hypothetical protein
MSFIRPEDATEVSRVVSLARETGPEPAVRSGGHSGAAHGVSEGGIVLDLVFSPLGSVGLRRVPGEWDLFEASIG